MSKEKQIEEMAHIVSNAIKTWVYEAPPTSNPHFVAAAIYDAGYRKQSEWISVDERLPGVTGNYICCVKDRNGNSWTIPVCWSLEMKTWFGKLGELKNSVTHWMPLPEPPKGE